MAETLGAESGGSLSPLGSPGQLTSWGRLGADGGGDPSHLVWAAGYESPTFSQEW